jgi:hypothetical protein
MAVNNLLNLNLRRQLFRTFNCRRCTSGMDRSYPFSHCLYKPPLNDHFRPSIAVPHLHVKVRSASELDIRCAQIKTATLKQMATASSRNEQPLAL